ncbi:MAG: AraC family transcriptional regulator [Pseudomonadota bacterium]|jgi:AraC-like DNA-binding protein
MSQPAAPTLEPIDRLSLLLHRFRLRARLLHSGALSGRIGHDHEAGQAYLHVLRRGALVVHHDRHAGVAPVLTLREPAVLLYARPLAHEFVLPGGDWASLTCAVLEFDGAPHNPIVQSLPPLVCVPLARIEGLQPALGLLFAETDRMRCGSAVLVERLFEVVVIQLLRWLLDHPAEAGITGGMLAGLADPRLARAIVAMHGEPARDWSLAGLAASAGMSRSAFAANFKQATGVTPARYLGDWRLSLAASLLREGRPLKCIAGEVGFSGSASLSRAFRRRHGVGPRQWGAAVAEAGLSPP